MQTKELKQSAADKAKEVPLFFEKTDGNGFTYKIANPLHPSNVPQSGVIRIEALRRSNIKMPRTSFSKITDPVTGITYGIPMGIDKASGEMRFKRILIGEFNEFDCSNPTDKEMWMCISRSTFLLGSPFQSSKPLYRKEDKEADAQKVLNETDALLRAVQIAKDIDGLEFYDMMISFGMQPQMHSPSVGRSLLIQRAKDKPVDFVEKYDNNNRQVINIFNRCVSVGLITSLPDQGWLWKKSYPLGMSEAAAVGTMSKNPALANQMDLESKQKAIAINIYVKPEEITSSNIGIPMEEEEKSSVEFLTVSELKAEKEKIKNLAKEMENELNEIRELKKAFKQSAPVAKVGKVDYTLEDLQTEAHNLGWAKAYQCEDVHELIEEIKKRKVKK